jgi:cytidine kinase
MAERSGGSARDLAVNGHVNVDIFLRVGRFPGADRTEPVTATRTELGGTATTVALVAARSGLRVGLLSRIGEGFPAPFRRRLETAGIDLGGLQQVHGRSTPVCYVVEDPRGGQRTLIDQGPMDDPRGPPIPRGWLRRYAWVHVGTGPPAYQIRLAETARAEGRRVAVDPAQEIFYRWSARPFRRLLRSAEILFGNAAEITRACRLAGVSEARGLLAAVPLVVRTEGRSGASAFSRAGREHVGAVRPAAVRSLVGAGDAFRGGFYASYLAGDPMRRCLASGGRSATRWIAGGR